MKVSELIDVLQKLDGDEEIQLAIRTSEDSTDTYPITGVEELESADDNGETLLVVVSDLSDDEEDADDEDEDADDDEDEDEDDDDSDDDDE